MRIGRDVYDLALRGPDLIQNAPEIAAKYEFNIGIGVAAANQTIGQIEHALEMIEAVGVHLVAKSVTRFIEAAQPLLVLGHRIITIEIVIPAHSDMLDTDELRDVIEMVEQSLNVGRFPVRNEIAHAGDSNDAAFLRHFADRFVCFATRMVWIQGATVRMSDQHRRFRNFERIERSLIPQCAVSTAIPILCMRWILLTPKSLMPSSCRSVLPFPIRLRLL